MEGAVNIEIDIELLITIHNCLKVWGWQDFKFIYLFNKVSYPHQHLIKIFDQKYGKTVIL